MALVRRFFDAPSTPVERVHPTTVDCGYRQIHLETNTYLQLDTYGSDDREIPGKVSQSLQLDRRGAAELKRILELAFPGI